ncbi:hypothetical protein BGZ90_011922 [Linnemannia elongata]|nr:hypothetical protein BGZ90_011922 [Linnemannia elongata]
MPILIKGIEFTGIAVPELQRSCISSEVTEDLGICVHTVCYYYGEALVGEYVQQQALHSIPAYLGFSKQCSELRVRCVV